MACAFFGIECKVFMVRVSYDQKPYRTAMMETYGAQRDAEPEHETDAGRAILAADPDSHGLPGHRDLARRSRSRPRIRTPSTRWAAC